MSFPQAPQGQPFTEQVEALLALTGEIEADGGELLDTVRRLRELAVEHDDVDARFNAVANDVKRMLLERLEGRAA